MVLQQERGELGGSPGTETTAHVRHLVSLFRWEKGAEYGKKSGQVSVKLTARVAANCGLAASDWSTMNECDWSVACVCVCVLCGRGEREKSEERRDRESLAGEGGVCVWCDC